MAATLTLQPLGDGSLLRSQSGPYGPPSLPPSLAETRVPGYPLPPWAPWGTSQLIGTHHSALFPSLGPKLRPFYPDRGTFFGLSPLQLGFVTYYHDSYRTW